MRIFTFSLAMLLASCGDTGCELREVKIREGNKYTTCVEETCRGSSTVYRTCRPS